jgi:hypothetical protein
MSDDKPLIDDKYLISKAPNRALELLKEFKTEEVIFS